MDYDRSMERGRRVYLDHAATTPLDPRVLEAVATGVVSFDIAGRLTTMNRAAVRMLGLATVPRSGQSIQSVFAGPDLADLVGLALRASRGRVGTTERELRFRRDGVAVTLLASATRGFPKVGDEAFPGHMNYNNQLKTIMDEGGKIYACRFSAAALYGMRETDFIEGVKPIHPRDVADAALQAWREGAFVMNTWNL